MRVELTELQRFELDVRGVLRIRSVLSAEEVAALRTAVDAAADDEPGGEVASQRVPNVVAHGGPFLDLIDHPVTLGVLEALIGSVVRLDHAYAIRMAPGTTGLGLHGGGAHWDPAQFFVHREGRPHCGLVVLAWPLVDQPAGLGGFGCIPGSHHAVYPLPDGADGLVEEISVDAGDLLVFTEAIAHCTLPWRGEGLRSTLLYKYAPGSIAYDDPDVLRGVAHLARTREQERLLQAPKVASFEPVW